MEKVEGRAQAVEEGRVVVAAAAAVAEWVVQ